MIGVPDAIANQILEQIFGTGLPYEAPDTMYLALLTAEPDPADTGSTIVEVSYGGYARTAVAKTDLGAVADRVKVVTVDVVFPTVTSDATADVTHGCLLDAATDGNIIAVQELPPITLVVGNIPTFTAGSLAVTIP